MYRNLNFDTHEHHVHRSSEIRMKKRAGLELYGGNHNHGGHRNMGGNHNHGGHRNMGGNHNHGGHRNMGGYHEHFEDCNQSSMGCGGKHDQNKHLMNTCDQGYHKNNTGCGGKHDQNKHLMNTCDQGYHGNAMGCGGKHDQGGYEPYGYSATYNTYSKPL